jgi:hypothetical protein
METKSQHKYFFYRNDCDEDGKYLSAKESKGYNDYNKPDPLEKIVVNVSDNPLKIKSVFSNVTIEENSLEAKEPKRTKTNKKVSKLIESENWEGLKAGVRSGKIHLSHKELDEIFRHVGDKVFFLQTTPPAELWKINDNMAPFRLGLTDVVSAMLDCKEGMIDIYSALKVSAENNQSAVVMQCLKMLETVAPPESHDQLVGTPWLFTKHIYIKEEVDEWGHRFFNNKSLPRWAYDKGYMGVLEKIVNLVSSKSMDPEILGFDNNSGQWDWDSGLSFNEAKSAITQAKNRVPATQGFLTNILGSPPRGVTETFASYLTKKDVHSLTLVSSTWQKYLDNKPTKDGPSQNK